MRIFSCDKKFWLAFLITSLTGAAYYIVNDLVEFYNYEVVFTVKTENDQPTEFLTISFCSHQQNIYDTYFPLIKNLNVNTVDYESD